MTSESNAEYDEWLLALSLDEIDSRMRDLGVERVELKKLAPRQDNSKNQIYWRGNLNESPLPLGPFQEDEPSSSRTRDLRYRAALDFSWLTPEGSNPAPHAQLIHYPQYPESRLGGLLKGAELAPRSIIGSRESSRPGRLLLLGVAERHVFAIALPPEAPAAQHLQTLLGESVFLVRALTPRARAISADAMLSELSGVLNLGHVAPCKISGTSVEPNTAPNSAGTTLETLLGVRPNSRDEPDFHGWELKAHGDSRITLMTPAPTTGTVLELPAEQFMSRFGRLNASGTRWDFNGGHTALHVPGGRATTQMVVSRDEVQLVHTGTGELAMGWRVPDLLDHWARKHAHAAYVRYSRVDGRFLFGPYTHLGEGINFTWFWQALENGTIAVDPACNMLAGATSFRKSRYQFRCAIMNLPSLYSTVRGHDLRHVEPLRSLAGANLRSERLHVPDWVTSSAA